MPKEENDACTRISAHMRPRQIRRWAEASDGQPARVRETSGLGDPVLLRIEFPGYAGDEALKEMCDVAINFAAVTGEMP